MGPPVYLDTNAIIELVERKDQGLRSFMKRVNASGRLLVTSELTLAETLVKPIANDENWLVALYENLLTENEVIQTIPVSRLVLRRSAEIRAALGGSLPDTIHIATAVVAGCETFLSSDRRLKLPDGVIRIPIKDLSGRDEER